MYVAAASAALGAFSAIQQGQAQAKADSYNASVASSNAAVLRNNAAQAQEVAAQNETDTQYQATRLLSTQKAAAGAAGVDPNSGSPLEVMSSTAMHTTLDALRQKYQGDLEATNYLNQAGFQQDQANYDSWMGAQARNQSYVRAGASILNGASTYALYSSRFGGYGGGGYMPGYGYYDPSAM